jgi:mannose-1-phosphate guanylyltransferase
VSSLYALVLAGGRGTRFWPRSRRERPKQCVAIHGDRSYLQQTVERLLPIIPKERILIATGRDMQEAVRAEVSDLPDENILVEPWGRNTAPSIGWGAVEIGRREPDAIMGVFPSDHLIATADVLRTAVLAAADATRATNALVTLGIEPSRPETGYGYLERGPEVGAWGGLVFHAVERFTEKPDPDAAARYLEGGKHLWNAGMFVFRVDAIRDAFRAYLPRSATALERIQHAPDLLEEQWGELDATSIDYGIMERSRHILTIPCDPGWSDIGTWTAAGETMPRIEGGRGMAAHVIAQDSKNCVVHAPNKLVALLGLEGVVVVDTKDALLVMDAAQAQHVGDLVRRLEHAELTDFT